MVDRVKLPLVCDKSWDELRAGHREDVRYCTSCMRSVWDLRSLNTAELESLIAFHGSDVCAHVHRRPDGTPVGRDCSPAPMPVPGGLRRPMSPEEIAAQIKAQDERAASVGHDRRACPICSQ